MITATVLSIWQMVDGVCVPEVVTFMNTLPLAVGTKYVDATNESAQTLLSDPNWVVVELTCNQAVLDAILANNNLQVISYEPA